MTRPHGFAMLDLLATALVGWLALSLMYLVPLEPLRVALGLAAVIFAPGYALLAGLFPRERDLTLVERLGLSLGLSIVIAPLVGLLLSTHRWIGTVNLALAIAGTNTVLCGLGAIRRAWLPADERFALRWPARLPGRDAALRLGLNTMLGSALVVAAGAFVYHQQQWSPQPFTEFYVLDSNGTAEAYPDVITVGQPVALTLSIWNNERRSSSYQVRILLPGQPEQELTPITLNDGELWRQLVEVTPRQPAEKAKLEFQLFRDGAGAPYQAIYIWVMVQEARPRAEGLSRGFTTAWRKVTEGIEPA